MKAEEYFKSKYGGKSSVSMACHKETFSAIEMVRFAEEYANQSKWIRFNALEEPEMNQWCLIHIAKTLPLVACYQGVGNWLSTDPKINTIKENVTHWRPLPEKP